MATCHDCNQDMTAAPTCSVEVLLIDGASHRRRRWRPPRRASDLACHDCGVAPGGLHHLGCEEERCPVCSWQLISCGCGQDDRELVDVRAFAG